MVVVVDTALVDSHVKQNMPLMSDVLLLLLLLMILLMLVLLFLLIPCFATLVLVLLLCR